MKDYYNVLGVEPDASDAEIKRMYHKLSKKYHPDANIDDPELRQWSEARMKELNEAYTVLRDPLRRAEYDRRRGYARSNPGPSSSPTGREPSPMAQLRESIVLRSAAMSALSFGLVGLLRGGLPVARSGAVAVVYVAMLTWWAVVGAILGIILGNIRIIGLPPGATQGLFIGMLLGAILFKLSITGLLVGAVGGAFVGWWLTKR